MVTLCLMQMFSKGRSAFRSCAQVADTMSNLPTCRSTGLQGSTTGQDSAVWKGDAFDRREVEHRPLGARRAWARVSDWSQFRVLAHGKDVREGHVRGPDCALTALCAVQWIHQWIKCQLLFLTSGLDELHLPPVAVVVQGQFDTKIILFSCTNLFQSTHRSLRNALRFLTYSKLLRSKLKKRRNFLTCFEYLNKSKEKKVSALHIDSIQYFPETSWVHWLTVLWKKS